MARARQRTTPTEPLALPEGKPLPDQPSPGAIEGVEPDWPGGASNLGEVINPGFETPAPYSMKDLPDDVPKVEMVLEFQCETCGQAFSTQAVLNVHRRTAHHRHR